MKRALSTLPAAAIAAGLGMACASGPSVARAWQELRDAFESKASELTLADLAPSSEEGMYYI